MVWLVLFFILIFDFSLFFLILHVYPFITHPLHFFNIQNNYLPTSNICKSIVFLVRICKICRLYITKFNISPTICTLESCKLKFPPNISVRNILQELMMGLSWNLPNTYCMLWNLLTWKLTFRSQADWPACGITSWSEYIWSWILF